MCHLLLSRPLRKQSGHPARGERCGEGEAQRRARAFRRKHAPIDQRGDKAAAAAFAGSENRRRFRARDFAAIEHGFEQGAGFGRQLAHADFLFRPQQDACAQLIRLHQVFHEGDLIDAGGEEEARELRQGFFAQMAPSVEIVAAWQVAGGKVAFIGIDIAGEAAGDRPDAARVERFQQRGVRHQPRDTAVAIEERVNPGEAVVCRRRRDDSLGLAELAVDLFKALEEARHGGRADGDMDARPRHRGRGVRRG